MNNQHRLLRKYGIWLLDILCVVLSYRIALLIRYDGVVTEFNRYYGNIFSLFLALFVTIFNFTFKRNRDFLRHKMMEEIGVVLLYNFYLVFCLIAVAFLMHQVPMLSRLMTGYFGVIDTIMMFVLRRIIRGIVIRTGGREAAQSAVIIITETGMEKQTEEELDFGITDRLSGILSVDGERIYGTVNGHSVDSSYEHIADDLVTAQIDDVFIRVPDITEDQLHELIDNFETMGASCHYAITPPTTSLGNGELTEFCGQPAFTYTLNRQGSFGLVVKRIFDIIGGIVGMFICILIGIVLVPAIKIDSPGPAIFSQIRIGKNGRKFKFYKFRSMYVDAEERKKELEKQNEMNGLMFKMEDDPRITRVGKFIRKTSLDEFPQFWNVLKGDMSLVGTRPPTEDEFRHYSVKYKRRLAMTPGITGMWQVSGRSDITDFDKVVKLDLYYIDHWSIGLDLKILFKTVAVVFKHKGAE